MSKVCVVTGGGSGMGLAAAKLMPKDHIIVVSGRTESKLTKAVEELTAAGFTAYAKSCDTSKRDSVQALAEYAATLGEITNVIHAAGVSPAMKVTPPTCYTSMRWAPCMSTRSSPSGCTRAASSWTSRRCPPTLCRRPCYPRPLTRWPRQMRPPSSMLC